MTDNNQPKSRVDVLKALGYLSEDFKHSAEAKGRNDLIMAKILDEAAQALQAEQAKNQQLQAELSALKSASTLKKAKGKSYTFLVDGSGSMCAGGFLRGPSLLKTALDGIDAFAQATAADVKSALWGAQTVHAITDRKQAENGLFSETNFVPAVDYMQSLAAVSKKRQHFVIVGDGDIKDQIDSLTSARVFLKSYPNATIDFVVMQNVTGYTSCMYHTAKALQHNFPAQVSFQEVAVKEQPFYEALTNIAVLRAPAAKKKSVPQPKP